MCSESAWPHPTSDVFPAVTLVASESPRPVKRARGSVFNPRGYISTLALCAAPARLPNPRDITERGRQAVYLKEGDIGKAESEEVVPVEGEAESVSQAGSAGWAPGSSCACLRHGLPTGGLQGADPSFTLHSSPRSREETPFYRRGNRLGKWPKERSKARVARSPRV